MSVAIIDYGSGNLRSAAKAFERANAEAGLSQQIKVTSDPDVVARADRVVLPGVGAYGDCIQGLQACDGMVEALQQAVVRGGIPFIGICVGMQLMATVGREFGNHSGLNWIPGEVIALQPDSRRLKIPHMGWNNLNIQDDDHPVLAGLDMDAHAYFVHSYCFQTVQPGHTLAQTTYGYAFPAVVGRDNMIGTQFHPEKSQTTGLRLITNFLTWTP